MIMLKVIQMDPNLSPEALQNLGMLREFFAVPENCSNPRAFLKGRRELAERLYATTQGTSVVEPANAIPPKYDPKTHFRTSPDIVRFRGPDDVWYHASGIRDESRSPKKNLTHLIYFKK